MTARSQRARRCAAFTLMELMLVVAILGVLAMVAIPAFVRYMRVAKTAEAYRLINKITTGAIGYFSRAWFDTKGRPARCQFPGGGADVNSPSSDPSFCCTDGEADGKCEPNETVWDHKIWRALLFKVADKHYYSYGFVTSTGPWVGDGSWAHATA